MVRVTHPPGGRPKLECEAAPSPKAVRVLKPPGGGSSISFGDDDVPVVKAKAVAPPSAPPAEIEATNGDSAPEAAAAGGDDGSSAASTQAEAPSSPSSETASNGTAPSSPTKSASVDDFPPIKVDCSTESMPADVPATNGSATNGSATNGELNGKAEPCTTNGTAHVNGNAEVASTNGVGETNGHSTPKTNGTSEGHTNGTSENVAPAKSSSPSSSPSPSPSSGSPQPSSPTPPSPGVNSPDTRDRLFGANAAPPKAHVVRSTPSNHHMRSSIFGSSDEPEIVKTNSRGPSASSPTRERGGKAEMAAAVPQQQAPVRVRQPPGGYSSKLW